jgi:SAM-dependent methyltransferase
MDSPTFKPWYLQWTADQVTRFWDWYSASKPVTTYFSAAHGPAILREVAHYLPLVGTAVEIGSGQAFMTERLLDTGMRAIAVDGSPKTVAAVSKRLAARSNFLGGTVGSATSLPLAAEIADLVLMIELVEHMDEASLRSALSEARRVCKRGGYIVVTTPNEEDLTAAQTMCPHCGCVFHTMQHLRSFSTKALTDVLSTAGFTSIVCRPTTFSGTAALYYARTVKHLLMRRSPPNLLYIGKRES